MPRGISLTGGRPYPKDIASRGGVVRSPEEARRRLVEEGQAIEHGLAGIIFPPSFFPPSGAKYFTPTGNQVVTGPNVTATMATFRVPQNSIGVVRSIVLSANDFLASADVVFALKFDGGPVEGWSNIQLFPRNAASVSLSFEAASTAIDVPDGSLITLDVTVRDAGSYRIGALIHGWYYGKDVRDW